MNDIRIAFIGLLTVLNAELNDVMAHRDHLIKQLQASQTKNKALLKELRDERTSYTSKDNKMAR